MLIRILISMGLAFMTILLNMLIVYIIFQANEGKLWANILLWLIILLMITWVIYQVL